MFRPETGGGENGADVGEGALGLRGRAVWNFARGGIDRKTKTNGPASIPCE